MGLNDIHFYLMLQLSPNGDCSSLLHRNIDVLVQDRPKTQNWNEFVTQFRRLIHRALTLLPTLGTPSVSREDLMVLLKRVGSVEEGRLACRPVMFQRHHDYTLRSFLRL